jgi:hypothetical protein
VSVPTGSAAEQPTGADTYGQSASAIEGAAATKGNFKEIPLLSVTDELDEFVV